jgi:hypothetical protein
MHAHPHTFTNARRDSKKKRDTPALQHALVCATTTPSIYRAAEVCRESGTDAPEIAANMHAYIYIHIYTRESGTDAPEIAANMHAYIYIHICTRESGTDDPEIAANMHACIYMYVCIYIYIYT